MVRRIRKGKLKGMKRKTKKVTLSSLISYKIHPTKAKQDSINRAIKNEEKEQAAKDKKEIKEWEERI